MLLDPRSDSHAIIRAFGLAPHPEGGWYAETFRAPAEAGTRSAVSAIYFLLQAGERSHWHTVDACELWMWHAGSPLKLELNHDSAQMSTLLLGPSVERGEQLQAVVPVRVWQWAQATGAWTLVSCIVAPAFDFAGFTIAPAGWSPVARLPDV